MKETDDPLQPHSHEPNPAPPSATPGFWLQWDTNKQWLTPTDLKKWPLVRVPNCYIVSTGHGRSGPFLFGGVAILTLIDEMVGEMAWTQVEVVSGDGFGTRLWAEELRREGGDQIILSYERDKRPLTREAGLVRLIVPSEADDALRQVKWVATVTIK
ncbi:MAG TPA: hypothetical protein VLL52_16955 [Anaerolineae bacterium]|nr:hypothetical protein [Anaerolineae bacterium]